MSENTRNFYVNPFIFIKEKQFLRCKHIFRWFLKEIIKRKRLFCEQICYQNIILLSGKVQTHHKEMISFSVTDPKSFRMSSEWLLIVCSLNQQRCSFVFQAVLFLRHYLLKIMPYLGNGFLYVLFLMTFLCSNLSEEIYAFILPISHYTSKSHGLCNDTYFLTEDILPVALFVPICVNVDQPAV